MGLAHYQMRRWIVVMSFAILCLTITALVLMWVRSHSPFTTDDLYWIVD